MTREWRLSVALSLLCHFGFGGALVWAATHSARPLALSAIPVTLIAVDEAPLSAPARELAPPAPLAPPEPPHRAERAVRAPAPAVRPALTAAAPAPAAAPVTRSFTGHGHRMPYVEAAPPARQLARPSYARNPAPDYPASARRRRQQGVVLLRVGVTAAGRASSVALARSSGFAALDASALEAVRGWEFEPARLGARPVDCEIEVPVRFALDD